MATSYEEWLRKVTEKNKPQQDSEIAAVGSMYDTQKKDAQTTFDKAVKDTTLSYEDAYRQNEVQRLVNERSIAENMANMGLTDSGLNRTQMTASQLSYANQKGKLDRQKQSAVDELTFNLAQVVSAIDAKKAMDIEKVKSNYAQFNSEQATALRNAELEQETENTKNYYSYLSTKATTANYQGLPTATVYNKALQYYDDGNYYSLEQLINDNGYNMTTEQWLHWRGLLEEMKKRKTTLPLSPLGAIQAGLTALLKNKK